MARPPAETVAGREAEAMDAVWRLGEDERTTPGQLDALRRTARMAPGPGAPLRGGGGKRTGE